MKWKPIIKVALLAIALVQGALTHAEAVWIDVRTSLEHSIDNIDGDIRISHGEIVREAARLFPVKGTEVRLYCLSGGRSGKAAAALRAVGYTNVINVGGIDDARKERGLAQ